MAHQILFVDDEERVLQGLRRMLRPMRDDWDMTFAMSGEEALRLIESTTPDVVVSDMRMPGMDGAQLLGEAMVLRPQMLRMALTGQSDTEMTLRCVQTTHQYLMKPCDPLVLKTAISRACELRDRLNSPALKLLVTGTGSLPSRPEAYDRLVAELGSTEPRLDLVAQIVSSDMAMSAKSLQLVNSAFFAAGQPVASPARAVMMLGIDTLRWLVELSTFHPAKPDVVSHMQWLWTHADETRRNARAIATIEGWDTDAVEGAAAAGLLHDVGRLLLATSYGQCYADLAVQTTRNGIDFAHAEEQEFGANHAAVGASLLGFWGLPTSLVDAVGDHQARGAGAVLELGTPELVRLADALAKETNPGDVACANTAEELIPEEERERLTAWRAACDVANTGSILG